MKKLLCVFCVAALLQQAALALPAFGTLHAKSAALYAANGQMLYEQNADQPLQPASVTKIMTMLLTMEALERGEVSLDTMITGSDYACSMGGTQIWLETGEQLTLDEMLKAIAVGSANDCAVAVAEHLAGTEAAFVERMNARASALGCTNTQFINANGLDGIGQKTMTSAHDLALISCELLRHSKILEYTGIWMDTIRGGAFTLANTNKMLRSYQGLTGLKTGYISEAGFCISASAEREGLSLVAVVMAAPTKEDRMADATALLNYGFANFAAVSPDLSGLKALPVLRGRQDTVQLTASAAPLVLEKDKAAGVTTELVLPEAVAAPVKAGDKIGEARVCADGQTLLTIPVTAAETIEAKTAVDFFLSFWQGLLCEIP